MNIPIKQILLEGTLDTILNTIKTKFQFFLNKFKYLNEEEFETLLKVIYGWYYLNYKFPDDLEKRHPEIIKLFNKIKLNSNEKLPSKLYRGLSFATKKDFDNFLKECKTSGLVNGKIFRLNQNTKYTAWSSSKKIAKTFLPGGENSYEGDKFGCLLVLNTKDIDKDNITFGIKMLLTNEEETKEFLQMVLKSESDKNIKYINDTKSKKLDPKKMFGFQHGSVFSVMEDEYILNNVPYNKCKSE